MNVILRGHKFDIDKIIKITARNSYVYHKYPYILNLEYKKPVIFYTGGHPILLPITIPTSWYRLKYDNLTDLTYDLSILKKYNIESLIHKNIEE